MRAFSTYAVSPYLPESLEPLRRLANDLWWTWNPDALALLQRIDRKLWEETRHNPVLMLGSMPQEQLDALANDESFIDHLSRVVAQAEAYRNEVTWRQREHEELDGQTIAYFGLEFGLSECLAIYSGGLGVLAGDDLKSASDLGVPVIGIGLLYQEGYFRQRLNPDGWQQEDYPDHDFEQLPVEHVRTPQGDELRIQLSWAGRWVHANVWKVTVGRVALYLLDTNVEANAPEDRAVTARLYGGDPDMRIRQEILLGIGGVVALRQLGVDAGVFHMNEGHSAFLALERIRQLIEDQGLSFAEAAEAVAASNVFTTHTPVAAGQDRFDPALVDKYFSGYYERLGLSRDEFLGLGRADPTNLQETLCMTVLAMRLSRWRNGVSQLHGEVSRRLWAQLWPGVPEDEVPISAITNGVHVSSWISRDMATLFDRYLGPRWRQRPREQDVWDRIKDIPDTELWPTHERRRERLVAFARGHLRAQLQRRGASAAETDQADEVLDPEALTIGFGRRFTTYKRGTLLLRDPDRLIRLVTDKKRPVQIIFAGKAHPHDNPAKQLIRDLVHFVRRPEVRHRIVFLEDYDINLARYMVQGTDVWLNTPKTLQEASGTSGMKATANGALNLSILDGWWREGYSPDTGWAIGRGETYDDADYQDEVESQALYDLLEKEVVPLFYDRAADGLPRRWIAMMKTAMVSICPMFNSNRMVAQYTDEFYVPALQYSAELSADGYARARALAAWKARVRAAWPNVSIEQVVDDSAVRLEVGARLTVRANVRLAGLSPSDVVAELYYGSVDAQGEIRDANVTPMTCQDAAKDVCAFVGTIECRHSGLRGYTVRVLPNNEDLISRSDMGLITWSQ